MSKKHHLGAATACVFLLTVALAGCGPSEPTVDPAPSSSPTNTSEGDDDVTGVVEPLTLPSCDTMLSLADARSLFSNDTVVLVDSDSVTLHGHESPEITTTVTNASVSKECAWGVPNSDGAFSLIVTDIGAADAAALASALIAEGHASITVGPASIFELETETEVGMRATVHNIVDDIWVYVQATGLALANQVADNALTEVLALNPSRG